MDTDALKALADENRLAIIRALARRERCLCEVAEELGLSDALVSHHVKRLREAGLLRSRRVGRWQYCRLDAERLRALGEAFDELAQSAAGAPDAAIPGECEQRRSAS